MRIAAVVIDVAVVWVLLWFTGLVVLSWWDSVWIMVAAQVAIIILILLKNFLRIAADARDKELVRLFGVIEEYQK